MKNLSRLWKAAWQELTQLRLRPMTAAFLLLPFLALFFFDGYLLAHFRLPENSTANNFARFLSKWGDFYTGCFIAIALVFIFGIWKKKKSFQTLALAMLLAGALAGVTATALRFVSGRPRPSSQISDGLYGPRFEKNKHGILAPSYNYMSLPSAHAATAFGTVLPALILQPAVGVPLTVAAVAVGWSRFQLGRHNPTDIYLGFMIGGLFGIAFGRAARKLS